MLKQRRSFTLRERRLFKEGTAQLAKHGFHKYGVPINTRQGRRRRVLARRAFPPLPTPWPHRRPKIQPLPDAVKGPWWPPEYTRLVQPIYWGVSSSRGRRVPCRLSGYKANQGRLHMRRPVVFQAGPLEYAVPRWRNICKVSHENLKIYCAWLDTGS